MYDLAVSKAVMKKADYIPKTETLATILKYYSQIQLHTTKSAL